jgi:hypothetical protein
MKVAVLDTALAVLVPAPFAATAAEKVVATTIDFLDYCWYRTDPKVGYFTEQQYDETIRAVAECGIRKIYLRVNACGYMLNRTQVGTQYRGDGREPGSTYLVNTLAHYDPAAKTVELGHKYGLQVWVWDSLWDDAAGVYRIDPQAKVAYDDDRTPLALTPAELVARYGEYPLLDPFLAQHPEYQWQVKPGTREAFEKMRAELQPLHITKVVFESDKTGRPNRLTQDDLGIFTSTDNVTYQEYTRPYRFTVAQTEPRNVLVFDGLDLAEPYVKLVHRKPFPQDESFTLAAHARGCGRIFSGERELPSVWSYREQQEPCTEGGFKFHLTYGFAWDYGNYALGFFKGNSEQAMPEYYLGVTELAYPEMAAHKTGKLRELAAYGFDGFVYNLRSHSTVPDSALYGYNKIIRDRFLERYGKDIWKDDVDPAAWRALRAESVTAFLKEAKQAVGDKPLYMNVLASPDGERRNGYDIYGGLPWDYPSWIAAGSVDGITMLGFVRPELFAAAKVGGRQVKVVQFVEMSQYLEPAALQKTVSTFLANDQIDEIELYETQIITDRPEQQQALRGILKP